MLVLKTFAVSRPYSLGVRIITTKNGTISHKIKIVDSRWLLKKSELVKNNNNI